MKWRHNKNNNNNSDETLRHFQPKKSITIKNKIDTNLPVYIFSSPHREKVCSHTHTIFHFSPFSFLLILALTSLAILVLSLAVIAMKTKEKFAWDSIVCFILLTFFLLRSLAKFLSDQPGLPVPILSVSKIIPQDTWRNFASI